MLVRGPGILDQGRGLLVLSALTKSHKRPGIEPERTFVLIGGQQLFERAVIVLSEQASGKDVSYSLIVVRVQLEHIAVMAEGAGDVAEFQERARETGPGPHIRACFEKAPEVAGILLETLWSERQFPGLDTLRIVVSSLLDRSGCFFGQEDISISAKRRDAKCFTGERYPGTGVVRSPASYITSCAFAVASSPRRPLSAARKLSIARLSGNAAAALVFIGVFGAVFERGFFEIGIPCSSFRFSYRPELMGCPSDAGDNLRITETGMVEKVTLRSRHLFCPARQEGRHRSRPI